MAPGFRQLSFLKTCATCAHFYPGDGRVIPHCMKYDGVNAADKFPNETICDDFSVRAEQCAIDHETMTYKRPYKGGDRISICQSCVAKLLAQASAERGV